VDGTTEAHLRIGAIFWYRLTVYARVCVCVYGHACIYACAQVCINARHTLSCSAPPLGAQASIG